MICTVRGWRVIRDALVPAAAVNRFGFSDDPSRRSAFRQKLTHWRVSLYFAGMPSNLKLDDKLVRETVKLGHFRSKREAVNSALAEFVQRRRRLRILELAGQIDFDPEWDHKSMRRNRS